MARKKLIASAGLSMMDLISNALAGVIILFFILARTKFPSFPPERVCGTLVIEFSFKKDQQKDFSSNSVFSSLYIKYVADTDKNKDWLGHLKNLNILFDKSIIQFDSCIQQLDTLNCSYGAVRRGNDSINPIPAIRTYQIYNSKDTVKHIIVLHQPPEGTWEIGLLYNNHKDILEAQQTDSVKIHLAWYGINIPYYQRDTAFQLIAPTSRCWGVMRFGSDFEIRPDATLFGYSDSAFQVAKPYVK